MWVLHRKELSGMHILPLPDSYPDIELASGFPWSEEPILGREARFNRPYGDLVVKIMNEPTGDTRERF